MQEIQESNATFGENKFQLQDIVQFFTIYERAIRINQTSTMLETEE